MKKLVSLIAAAAMVSAVSGAAMAVDNNPAVYVDGREIFFDDQPAVIKDDRTLVPARGVFEAMGAKVDWYEDTRTVEVKSADTNTLVSLVIDDSTMKVRDMSGLFATVLSGQDFIPPETNVMLDAAPQIINDRTMIPLRAISEALNATVDWNGEAYCVEIATKDAPTEEKKETMPTYFLTASAETVAEGETVDIFINAKNIPAGSYVSGIAAMVGYNKDNFEFVEAKMVNGDDEVPSAVDASNPDYDESHLKVAYVTLDIDKAVKVDGPIFKLTFKSLNGKDGHFNLSDSYNTISGYNTTLLLGSVDDLNKNTDYLGNDLFIDTTPVFVNLEAAE